MTLTYTPKWPLQCIHLLLQTLIYSYTIALKYSMYTRIIALTYTPTTDSGPNRFSKLALTHTPTKSLNISSTSKWPLHIFRNGPFVNISHTAAQLASLQHTVQ